MGLAQYNKKRDFRNTTEPEGKEKHSKGKLIFVVQKHAASQLHYDFRLEMEGVLKSWAVPKGPSLNPQDKRLAVEVEDHPFDYKDFEGTIPEGNYGAGNVIVWDKGSYHAIDEEEEELGEDATLKALKAGKLDVVLQGEKLKGQFSLVKMRRADKKNMWLLIKKKDQHSSDKDILEKASSVISGKTVEDISDKPRARKKGKEDKKE